ncbi:MAG: sigma-70 family RNA polymerase sigma factor [Verrucomicrobiaceae bacterium]|nr:MAG: sigma-70 family RNA polymerase sigma factor [Verrucomicrobiaceae bacterium]
MEPDSDVTLMQRLRGGEDTALNELMQRWQEPLVAFIYRYTGHHEDAVDLAQETFVRIYESRSRYEPRGRFSTWLFTIASNLCHNHARWRARHPTVSIYAPANGSDGITLEETLCSPGGTPADTAEREDLASAVREFVQQLPHDLKTALLLFEYQELSHAEIAEVLSCTPKAVETRLYRARNLLRKDLAPWHT